MNIDTIAVVLDQPQQLQLKRLDLNPPGDGDLVVDVEWSGISTGTERLLWSGLMPVFPGMGYPLVPGYESVGRVAFAGKDAGIPIGERVFVPGACCFGPVHGLFGGAASRLVVPAARVVPVPEALEDKAILLALAATAYHALANARPPELIVGHGVLGRLLARITLAIGADPPVVWEVNPQRAIGAEGYQVLSAEVDGRKDYQAIYDASGSAGILDSLIGRLAPGGEIVLAGFYHTPVTFNFPPAFLREMRLRVAAEWKEPDMPAVKALVDSGRLCLDGLITHHRPATEAEDAYRTAFGDPDCLKMVLDWRGLA